jgi:hypothetical protein
MSLRGYKKEVERRTERRGGREAPKAAAIWPPWQYPPFHSIRPMLSPMGVAIFRQLGDQAQTNATVVVMS